MKKRYPNIETPDFKPGDWVVYKGKDFPNSLGYNHVTVVMNSSKPYLEVLMTVGKYKGALGGFLRHNFILSKKHSTKLGKILYT